MLARLVACALAATVALTALAAGAETAKVTGGEHGDFTRLVVEARGIGDWRFGRAADGYALETGTAVTAYDVTEAFRKIPRDRITALWRDPDSGRLRFSLACACHALAFEFRPGIVVIDIRTGAPPETSAFEDPLDPPPVSEVAAAMSAESPPPAPAASLPPGPGYDWLAIERVGDDQATPDPLIPLPTGEVSLDPLRDALLAQISRGAAAGVVEVAEGGPKGKPGTNRVDGGPWVRVALGEMPGLKAGADRDLAGNLTAAGQNCISDADLDVSAWGIPGPIPAQIGLGRSGMLTEFDTPLPEAILRTARFHVFVGFGAEARQFLLLLDGTSEDQARILRAMAHVVDEEPAAGMVFDGMESCDTAAALWATLARRGQPLAPLTNGDAVARSFSALPLHLRRYLGPGLVDDFLAAGDDTTARLLRDAILRVPADGLPEVKLMEARYHLAEGEDVAAGHIAAGVMAAAGPTGAEAAITLVEAAFQGNRQLDPKLPLALEAWLQDARGTAQEPRLLRARVLAAAMVADLSTAFTLVKQSPETLADLWSIAAVTSADDLFLEMAAEQAGDHRTVATATTHQMAERLLALGFPDLALQWLGPVTTADAADLRLLAARARVTMRDAPGALALLTGMDTADADQLRAVATLQLGDPRAAGEALIARGDTDAGQRALIWTQDWPLIGTEGPVSWRGAVALVQPSADEPATGPISRGTAMVEESARARATIEDLLLHVAALPADEG